MGNIQFINAGAGSGKTYTLTKLFCKRLAEGAKPSEFILTTYTKAAADEFRSKIKAKLMEEGKLFVADTEIEWMCLNCGYVYKGTKAPAICPVCSHDQGFFIRFELIYTDSIEA